MIADSIPEHIRNACVERIWQNPRELVFLYRFLAPIKPNNAIEIGTANGVSAQIWRELCTGKVITIDLNGCDQSARVGGIEYIEGDSKKPETRDMCASVLQGEKADFLFIDGDHEYEGAKNDYEMYRPLVSDGGVVAFHDVAFVTSRNDKCGAGKFFEELLENKTIIDPCSGNCGIGVVFCSGNSDVGP